MSMDVKIERFGLEMFNRIFNDYELKDYSPEPMPKSYESVECEMNEHIVNAVKVYMGLFHLHYVKLYDDAYKQFLNNEMDFLNMVVDFFPHEDDQFIASIAYVADLVLEGLNRGDSNFLSSAHLIWAMFVDLELLDGFYAQGGWRALRHQAFVLQSLHGFLREHFRTRKRYLHFSYVPVVKSVDAMLMFQEKDRRYQGDDPLALRWVDFVVKGKEVVVDMEDFDEVDLEDSVMQLKHLVDPHRIQQLLATIAVQTAEAMGFTEKQCFDAMANDTLDQYPGLRLMMNRRYWDFVQENERLRSRCASSYSDPSTVVLSAENGQINLGCNPSEGLVDDEKCHVINAIKDYYANTFQSCADGPPPNDSENANPLGGSTPHDPSAVAQSAQNRTNPSNDYELIEKTHLTNPIQNDDPNNNQSCTNQALKSIENFSSSSKPLMDQKSNKMKGKDIHDKVSTADVDKAVLLDQMQDRLQIMSPAVHELFQAKLVS